MTKVGRPLAFNSADELEEKITHYFDSITRTYPLYENKMVGEDEEGNPKFEQEPLFNNAGEHIHHTEYIERPTILGLARHIGITRETLLDYQRKEEFSDTIKKAKERIEEYLENQLYRKEQVTGIIFNLKNNFGWKDKNENKIVINMDELTEEELRQLAEDD